MNIHSKHRFWLFIIFIGVCFAPTDLIAQKRKKNKKKQNSDYQISDNTFNRSSAAQAEYYLIEGMKFFMLEKYDQALDNFLKASAFSSENASIDYKIAETYVKKANFDKAEIYAQKALEKEKSNKYIYILLGHIYQNQGKYKKAAEVYEQLIASNEGQSKYYYDLAEIYIAQKDYNKALESYEQLEQTFGLNESVIRRKQELYLSLNEFDKAIVEGEKLLGASPQNTKHLIRLSQLLMDNGQNDRALAILESAQQSDSPDPQLSLMLAKIYKAQGNSDKAVKILKTAFANPDLKADLKNNLIIEYLKESEAASVNDDLLNLAATTVNTHPQNANGHIVYGDLLLIKNQKNQALKHYVIASQLKENIQTKVWKQILSLEAQQYALDSLIIHSEKALELYPNQALFWLYNGSGHLGKGNYDEAIMAAEEGKRLAYNNPQIRDDLYVVLGDAYHGLEQYSESDAAYEFVLKNSPNHPQALNNYSFYLAERKDKLSRAKELAARLVENYPDNPSFQDTYGWVLFKAKEYKKAQKYLEKAAQNTNRGSIIEHYGDLLYKLGDTNDALNQWIKAKELGGTSKQIDEKIAEKKLIE